PSGRLMRSLRIAAAAAAIVMLAACGSSTPAVVPTPSPSPSPSPQVSPYAGIKPALAGLLRRDGAPAAAHPAGLGGLLANVHWAAIQAQAGGPIDTSAIDEAIASQHQLDQSGRMGLKIRLFAGVYAPDWAKQLGGAPIAITDPTTGASGTVGRFWSADFGAA